MSEDEVEQPVREDSLHQADEVRAERDALVAGVMLYGAQGLGGDFFRLADAEEGLDAIEHSRVYKIRRDGGNLYAAVHLLEFQGD